MKLIQTPHERKQRPTTTLGDIVLGVVMLTAAAALGFYVSWRSLSLPLPSDSPASALPWEEEPDR